MGASVPCRDAIDVEHAQSAQVGAVEVGMLCNGTQGVGALVAKGGGIRLCTDSKAVKDDQKNTLLHIVFSPFPPEHAPDK